MSFKSEVLGGLIMVGGVALAGYAGYRVIASMFPGSGNDVFSGLLPDDVFSGLLPDLGNISLPGKPPANWQDISTKETAEAQAAAAAAEAYSESVSPTGQYKYDETYYLALENYQRELEEYAIAKAAYKPTYGFFTGKLSNEAEWANVMKEYDDVLSSQAKVEALYRQLYGAQL